MATQTSSRIQLTALRVELAPGAPPEREPPSELRLVPAGTFRARDGRPEGVAGWRMDAAAAADCLAYAAAQADDPVIDYEHQTLYAKDNGQPAPAAGWWSGDAIEYRDAPAEQGGGLWATAVRWTARAAAHLRAGEYRYFSPVIAWDKDTGAVKAVVLGALTNRAAVDGLSDLSPLSALAAGIDLPDIPSDPEESMDLTDLRQRLGLADDADDAAILAAVDALKFARDTAQALATERDEQLAAATRDSVPRAVHDEAIAALRTQHRDHSAAELTRLIDVALEDGRIPGQATAEWLRGRGLDACRAYLADAQSISALTGTQTQGRDLDGQRKPRLADTELAVCTQMGLSPEQYLEQRAALFPQEGHA
jgi:phage I-like protein